MIEVHHTETVSCFFSPGNTWCRLAIHIGFVLVASKVLHAQNAMILSMPFHLVELH